MKLLPCLLALVFATTLTAAEKLQLTLPPHWHGVAGLPMSVYFDNIVLAQTPEQYRFEVRGMDGQSEARRWTVTPSDKDVGDRLEVIVKDSSGKELERVQTMLHISRRDPRLRQTAAASHRRRQPHKRDALP